ncbi:MAG: hypothetical protein ACOWWH_12695 [Eubacteriaceae bacterium]
MKAIDNMLKYASEIASKLELVNINNLEDSKTDMIKRNWNQLDEGRNSLDNPITPFYSDSYAKQKGFKIPDLKDKGDFRESFDVDIRDKEVVFGASDKKTPDLLDKYGEEVLGLTEKNANEVFEKIAEKNAKFIERTAVKYL